MASAFNENTSIFRSDDDNTLKINAQGQKPFRFVTQKFNSAPKHGETVVGFMNSYGQGMEKPIPNPTRLNEIRPEYKFPVNAAYLGSSHASRNHADVGSELRFGGNVRCQRSQQLVTEESYRRTDYWNPETTQQVTKDNDNKIVAVDIDMGQRDLALVPNYKMLGNNAVYPIPAPTRNDRIIAKGPKGI